LPAWLLHWAVEQRNAQPPCRCAGSRSAYARALWTQSVDSAPSRAKTIADTTGHVDRNRSARHRRIAAADRVESTAPRYLFSHHSELGIVATFKLMGEAATCTKLNPLASSGVDFARRRQLFVFDRILARVVRELGDSVILEGGVVVELRVERGRTTKDIDLRLVGSPVGVLDRLRTAAAFELGDFMIFDVIPDAEHPPVIRMRPEVEQGALRPSEVLAGLLDHLDGDRRVLYLDALLGVLVVVEGENLVDSGAEIQCHVAGDEHPECAQDREGPDEAHEILRLEPPCC
jgi:hypothetical protein